MDERSARGAGVTARCHWLVDDHRALRASGALQARAVHLLLERALPLAARARLEVDRPRLLAALGAAAATALLPDLPTLPTAAGLTVADVPLDAARRRLLGRVLSFEDEGILAPPLAYVARTVLRDARGRVILRVGDGGESFLFALPAPEHAALLESYRAAGIPDDAVDEVAVDIEAGLRARFD